MSANNYSEVVLNESAPSKRLIKGKGDLGVSVLLRNLKNHPIPELKLYKKFKKDP